MNKKYKIIALILGIVLVMTGCGNHSRISNEYLEISQYKGLEIPRIVAVEVTDQDVETEIESRIAAHDIKSEVKDRGIKGGDTIIVDCVGLIDGVAYDKVTAENKTLYVGNDTLAPGFDQNLIDHSRGEQFEFDTVLPDPYIQDTTKSGATIHWIVTLKAVYMGDAPEITDALVKNELKIPGVNTVEEYRTYVRNKLINQAESDAKYAREQAIWEAVYNNTILKAYPQGEIEAYVEDTTSAYEEYAKEEGLTFDEYMSHMDITASEFTEEITEAARNVVVQNLIFRSIAQAENLDVDFENYQDGLEAFAIRNGFESGKELEELYDEDEIRNAMMQEKVLEFLLESAKETGGTEDEMPVGILVYMLFALCIILALVIVFIMLHHRKKDLAAAQAAASTQDTASKLDENGYHPELEVPDPEEGVSVGDTQIISSSMDYEINSYDPAIESDPMVNQK